MDAESLVQAAQGCWAAFYLVHSMTAAAQDFAAADRQAARKWPGPRRKHAWTASSTWGG